MSIQDDAPAADSLRTAAERARIVALDKRHVWHPYTPMGDYVAHVEPLVIHHARGSRLYDADGRSFIDGNASWWTALLGHGHPRLAQALRRQTELLCHTSLAGVTHQSAAELAERLVAVAPPGLTRVFYSDDGSTAVEIAIKLALQYFHQNGRPRRTRFVALDGAFHGETLGVTALGGVDVFRRPFAGALMDCIHVPVGHDGYERAFDALARIVQHESDTIAAVVLEPIVQGVAGMRMYDSDYLRAAREVTAAQDIFLVLDEVFTGYGRTGPMWASQHADVSPDILCTAKGFTGGTLPMAATLTTERVFEGFLGDRARAFYYGHTFCGNPLGAVVARAVLDVYRDENILERARPKAARIAEAFERMRSIEGVDGTRSLGMIGALTLSGSEGYLQQSGWAVYREALKRGAYVRPLGNVVYVTPPLNIDDATLDELLCIVAASVRAAMQG